MTAESLAADDESWTWQPIIVDPALPADGDALVRLRASGRVVREVETSRPQLADLARTHAPGRTLWPNERERAAAAMLAGRRPVDQGRWVFYPWSGAPATSSSPAAWRESDGFLA